MSLTPLLDAFSADPVVRKVVETARRGDAPLVDVAVSPGARSPLLAALAGGGATPLLAVTATGREAEDLAAALRCFLPADRVADFPSWETLPHERLSPRSDTVGRGSRCCAGWPTPTRTTRRTARSTSWSPRSAPCCSRWSRGWATWPRSTCRPATSARSRRSSRRSRPRPTPAPTWSSAAASSPSAAASSTSSRRPRSTRVRVEFWGDTVEEIRWFKVADQRSLEVAEHGLWAPPCREMLLTDDVRERAARPRRPAARRGRPARQGRRGHRRRGHGVAGAGPGRRHGERARRPAPDGTARRPVRPRARPHPRPRPRRHQRRSSSTPSWANAAAGNAVPIDLQGILGTASYWTLADVPRARADHRRAAGGRSTRSPATRSWPRSPTAPTTSASASPSTPPTSSPTAATPPAAVADAAAAGSRDGWRVARRHRGPGPGPARRRGARRARRAQPAGRTATTGLEPGIVHVTTGSIGHGLPRAAGAARRRHRDRPDRHGRAGPVHQGHAPDAVAAAQPGRPAPAAARRLRRPRAARRRQVRRDGAAHRRRRDPRVPRHRVRRRASAASRATGSTCRPTSSTRSPATSAASAHPEQAGRLRLAQDQGPGQAATSSRSRPS